MEHFFQSKPASDLLSFSFSHSFLNSGLSVERNQPLDLCCRVFVGLITVALEQIPHQADALFAPVRLGVVRPTSPFQLHAQVMDALPVSSLWILFKN